MKAGLALVVAVLLGAPAAAAAAQVRDTLPPRRDSVARQDTVPRRDTILAPTDTAGRGGRQRAVISWAEEDSVMAELLSREGYAATRYQGDSVLFRAGERTIFLSGTPSAVGRGETILVGDTIQYNDSTQIVVARGDTLILRDPSRGEDDVLARGRIVYDIGNRRGLATNVNTAVESGERWIIHGERTGFRNDTTAAARNAFYARGGWLTSCEEKEPHYHFASSELKVVTKNVLVARPAILYIGDIPVFWLPFVFQDLRSGRRSGLIPPRVGVSTIVRNSPFDRRTVEDFGYYFNLGHYMDAEATMGWRSSARSDERDPGYIEYNGVLRYAWLDRFLSGTFAAGRHAERDGRTTQTFSLNHRQQFSSRSSVNAQLNYSSNTSVQRRAAFDAYSALAVIGSNLNFQQSIGSLQFSIGGDRQQYTGRDQVNQSFPTLSVTTKPIGVGEWLTWTPSLNATNRQSLNIDQTGLFGFRLQPRPGGGIDSIRVKKNTRTTNVSFETPLKIFNFNWRNSISIADDENDFPEEVVIRDVADSSLRSTRVFARTYRTAINWETGINLPSFFSGTWNLTPSVNFGNVESGPYLLRNNLTGTEYVRQTKRLSYGLGVTPTLFGLFPGFGPVSRFRHSINPTISYEYAPKATVSDAYLRAINATRQGYLGAIARNAITLGLSTNLEAKLRQRDDSASEESARKVKVLSVNFSSLNYNFELAKQTGRTGLTNQSFSYNVRSDLLPGFDFAVGYSLFEGNPNSDSARFKPYRESITGSLSLDRNSPIVGALFRLFGHELAPIEGDTATTPRGPAFASDNDVGSTRSGRPLTSAGRAARLSVPTGRGWQTRLDFSSTRQRPQRGGTVANLDPNIACARFPEGSFAYDQCVEQQALSPGAENPFNPLIPGSTSYRSPARTNLNASVNFNITPRWAASWTTSYDFQASDFGSHSVSLQRELHDWNAIFAFTQAPNGNFAFNFFIALKAQPDIKFNYDRYSRPGGGSGALPPLP